MGRARGEIEFFVGAGYDVISGHGARAVLKLVPGQGKEGEQDRDGRQQ